MKIQLCAHDERNFQYPSKDRPTIVNVNLTVSQVSRVAVVSTNGARKSTVIKGLVGEQLPTSGSIRKAAGARTFFLTFVDRIILNKCDLLLNGNLKTEGVSFFLRTSSTVYSLGQSSPEFVL